MTGLLAKLLGADPLNAVKGILDEVVTTKEEKGKLDVEWKKAENEISGKIVELQKSVVEAQAQIITAEATGRSWLQRNWRPLLMLIFTYIVLNNYVLAPIFGMPHAILDQNIWDLLKLGVGGYIVGQSGENIFHEYSKAKLFKDKEKKK